METDAEPVRFISAGVAEVKPTQIKEHPKNYNKGDMGAISTSIDSVGFYGRIIVSKRTKFIVAGNHRYRALVAAGAKKIPIEWVDVDEEDEKRILAIDNRAAELATKDDAKLAELLTDLAQTERGFEGIGYEGEDLVDLIAQIEGQNNTGGGTNTTSGPREEKSNVVIPEQYMVLIECDSEASQKQLLERLIEEGLKCRALNS